MTIVVMIEFSVLYNELTKLLNLMHFHQPHQILSNKCFSFPFLIKTGFFLYFFCQRQPNELLTQNMN